MTTTTASSRGRLEDPRRHEWRIPGQQRPSSPHQTTKGCRGADLLPGSAASGPVGTSNGPEMEESSGPTRAKCFGLSPQGHDGCLHSWAGVIRDSDALSLIISWLREQSAASPRAAGHVILGRAAGAYLAHPARRRAGVHPPRIRPHPGTSITRSLSDPAATIFMLLAWRPTPARRLPRFTRQYRTLLLCCLRRLDAEFDDCCLHGAGKRRSRRQGAIESGRAKVAARRP